MKNLETSANSNVCKIDFFGEDASFDHIGVAVVSLKGTRLDGLEGVEDPTQKVSVAFAEIHGLPVEFIEPRTDDAPVRKNLENGQALVHLCFNVPDINSALEKARKYRFHPITKPVPAPAFGGNNIIWLYHKVFGLFELVEVKGE